MKRVFGLTLLFVFVCLNVSFASRDAVTLTAPAHLHYASPNDRVLFEPAWYFANSDFTGRVIAIDEPEYDEYDGIFTFHYSVLEIDGSEIYSGTAFINSPVVRGHVQYATSAMFQFEIRLPQSNARGAGANARSNIPADATILKITVNPDLPSPAPWTDEIPGIYYYAEAVG